MDIIGEAFFIIILVVIGIVGYLSRREGRLPAPQPPPGEHPGIEPVKSAQVSNLYKASNAVEPFLNQASIPSEFLSHQAYLDGVEILCREQFTTQDLLAFYNGDNFILGCMALTALERRPDEGEDLTDPILRTINSLAPWTRWFALRTISARGRPPLVGRVLAAIDHEWNNRYGCLFLREFLQQRFEAGETPDDLAEIEEMSQDQVIFLTDMLKKIGTDVTGGLLQNMSQAMKSHLDLPFLSSIGKIWPREDHGEKIIAHETLRRQADGILSIFRGDHGRSLLVVGPQGTGKSSLLRFASRQLQGDGWTIFEASAQDVMAGQVFIGMQDERLKNILQNLGKGRVLWIIPRFQEMMWAGRHMQSPVSVLDRIIPAIESGEIRVVGEIQPEACDQLLRRYPGLKGTMELLRVEPLPEKATLELARSVAKDLQHTGGLFKIPDEILPETLKLAGQYMGRDSSPGHALDLLKRAVQARAVSGERSGEPLSSSDLLTTLSGLTGLPSVVLDERESLDLYTLRRFFEDRVLGQPEAVDCLVDRVAMIKAGLTDPTRPLGVFLFAGPTGTGKTELAKALAEFLFGSPDRMLRLDMSEFQTSDSLSRILGDTQQDSSQEALVDSIRNQPFSVLLLDEFEKAHERIWDIFLQLFDDGRLTDRRGNTADFRHAIVIMTTNLGSQHGRHIGFGPQPEQDTRPTIEREFRKEFLNRIDRIVVFRALSRAIMRDILMKELDEVLSRRGLRTRQWAVEWESSAIDFLLSRGFTEDLGARPLKRSIERYLLSPLANTIVNHQFPEGDQFLFVRSDGNDIDVAFVDPDEPEYALGPEIEPDREVSEPQHVRDIALSPRGELRELDLLREHFNMLREKVGEESWTGRKKSCMEAMNSPGFWESGERFSVLGTAEYMDRIEEGLRTAGSLLERLSGGNGRHRDKFSTSVIRRVAQRIYLVEAACRGLEEGEPYDAFLFIEAARHHASHKGAADAFSEKLQLMYTQWARQRGMRCTSLMEEPVETGGSFHTILAVSGLAAYPILKFEQGIHEMEDPGPRGSSLHVKVQVRVTPQPDEPVHDPQKNLLSHARASLQVDDPEKLRVVRRYREEPSPLVRDSVRKFRTGRIDVVWRGDFDLL